MEVILVHHLGSNATEEYDGSSFSSGGNLPQGIYGNVSSTNGTQTAALSFGGRTAPGPLVADTVGYDGTSWSTRPSMANARYYGGGSGTTSAAMMAGGANPTTTPKNLTEEFTGETTTVNIKDFTTS